MKCWIEINRSGGRVEKRTVKPGEVVGTATGECPNPECKANPFYVKGANMRPMSDDRTYKSDGYCAACGDPVGYIYARPSTIFGLEEDERVIYGRARVY